MTHVPSRIQPGLARNPAALLFAVVVLLSACSHQSDQPSTVAQAPRTVAAETSTLSPSSQQNLTLLSGTVVSSNQVQVASRLMGYIAELRVKEGQTVKAGELLFRVDPADIQGQVAQARAGLAQAQANLANAKADYERFGNLYKEEAIPRQQWEQIQLRYQVAQEQVAAARAGYNTAGSQMRYASVTSPISGVVVQKLANAGDLATPGRPVLVIEGQGRLQAATQVPGAVFHDIKLGETVQVFAGDKAIAGTIAQAVPVADPMSHTHTVKIDLPATSGLESGRFVRVGFAVGSSPQLRIPQRAVVDRAGMIGVFVVDEKGLAHFRLVRLGAVAGGMVDVQAGLNPGDKIVTSNLSEVENGVKIAGGNRG
ncbi:efflux RND transporter periplasmic adaptor subunit [Thiomonas sp. FB-Cd]|uniref:efflux RND transporter periplasmic adaptor subunit n=1 Tax=Thiomonas sp. FB-Cd TaxID=1158292 RepID=UPI0004DFB524|nr:efflux RND transporter periplasmic adaptor subunit [Thiomonas sp. FB-Cd]